MRSARISIDMWKDPIAVPIVAVVVSAIGRSTGCCGPYRRTVSTSAIIPGLPGSKSRGADGRQALGAAEGSFARAEVWTGWSAPAAIDQSKKAAVKLGDFTALTLPTEGA